MAGRKRKRHEMILVLLAAAGWGWAAAAGGGALERAGSGTAAFAFGPRSNRVGLAEGQGWRATRVCSRRGLVGATGSYEAKAHDSWELLLR